MTTDTIPDYVFVKQHHPEAFLKTEQTYAGGKHYTILDPRTSTFLGPTAFTAENAWKWAAERIRRSTELSQ